MIDRRLIRIAAEPVRLRALNLLNDRPARAREVAAELEISVAAAERHLDAMKDEGLIEVVDERPDHGAREPRYRALVRTLFEDEEWAALSLGEKRRLTAWILDMIEADARESLASGTFFFRPDAHLSRTATVVDEQGWQELRRIFDDALRSIFAAQAAAAERLAETGEAGFPVLAAMLNCELPPRPWQPPG